VKVIYRILFFIFLFLQITNASYDVDLLTSTKIGNSTQVEDLLRAGANPNYQDDKGISPLLLATYNGNFDIVKLLLNANANVNIVCNSLNLLPEETIKYKDTPLSLAVSQEHLSIASFLIQKGANLNVHNNLNRTALLLAVQSGNIEMVQILINAGANINEKSGLDENTPLIESVKKGSQKIVNLLVSSGAEIDIVNKNGESALFLAKQNGMSVISTTLKKKGAVEEYSLFVKIPIMMLFFFIVFIFVVNVVPFILPSNMSLMNVQASAFIIAFTLGILFVAIAWQVPLTMLDSVKNELFDGFMGLVSSFVSLLFFIIGVNLFFKHITSFFRSI